MVIWVYKFVNTHWNVHLKCVHLITCKLYLSKVDLQKKNKNQTNKLKRNRAVWKWYIYFGEAQRGLIKLPKVTQLLRGRSRKWDLQMLNSSTGATNYRYYMPYIYPHKQKWLLFWKATLTNSAKSTPEIKISGLEKSCSPQVPPLSSSAPWHTGTPLALALVDLWPLSGLYKTFHLDLYWSSLPYPEPLFCFLALPWILETLPTLS